MSGPGDAEQEVRLDYVGLADAAERLAQTEEETARIFEWLARRGGNRAGHRRVVAEEALQQMERLRRWACELRRREAE